MCTKMKVVLGVGALVSMLGVFMSPAHATAVAVADPSFEENVVAPGATLAPSNWGGIWSGMAPGEWLAWDSNAVVWRPTSANFPSIATTGSLPSSADGQQCLTNIGQLDSGVGQLFDGLIQPHETITLTVAVGMPLGLPYNLGTVFAFAYQDPTDPTGMTGGEIFEQDGPNHDPTLVPGTFIDFSVSMNTDDYIVPGAQPGDTDEYGNPLLAAGDNLLAVIDVGPGMCVDNVRVSVVSNVVPEPSTLVLMAAGLLGYAFAKRRR